MSYTFANMLASHFLLIVFKVRCMDHHVYILAVLRGKQVSQSIFRDMLEMEVRSLA
jgi:hypothetical protein